MAENNRLDITKDVIGAFEKLMSAHRNEISCTIVSAEVGSLLVPCSRLRPSLAGSPCAPARAPLQALDCFWEGPG